MTIPCKCVLGSLLLLASGCGKKEDAGPPTRRVQIRITATDLTGLGAAHYFDRRRLNGRLEPQQQALATNNTSRVIDDLRMEIGEAAQVVLVFKEVTAASSVRPGPAAQYTAEILVDGAVQERAVLDRSTPLNANGNFFAVAEAEIK